MTTTLPTVTLATSPDGTEYLTVNNVRGDAIREAISGWLRAVDVDPYDARVGDPIAVTADRHTVTVREITRTADGGRIFDGDQWVTRERVIALDQPAPPWPQLLLDAADRTPSTCPLCGHHQPADLPEPDEETH